MPADATAAPVDTRTTLERLVDLADELYMAAWSTPELDRQELRELVGETMGVATALFDAA